MRRVKIHRIAAVEAELLKIVRARGHISRVELARGLHIAPSTAGIYVDRLVQEGFLLESGRAQAGYGRPPTLLTLNPEGGRFVGLDFEARNIMATAVDFSQAPLRQVHRRIAAGDSARKVLQRIELALDEVIVGDPRPVLGIGVGVPGDVDPASGLALHYPFIKGWKNVPVGERLQKRFGVPVFLENNTRAMALAEMWFGQGRGLRDFVCLGVRSGIAAGIVANGRLLRGTDNQAGEIGRWSCPVPATLNIASRQIPGVSGPSRSAQPQSVQGTAVSAKPPYLAGGATRFRPWDAGACLEQVASLSAGLNALRVSLRRRRRASQAGREGEVTVEQFFAAVHAGEACAQRVLQELAEVQGWAIAQLATILDPQKVILTGPLTELGELFLKLLRAAAKEWTKSRLPVEITCSTLGKFNGALGAAALALHQWKPKR